MPSAPNGYQQRAEAIVLKHVPKAIVRFMDVSWVEQARQDGEGIWLYGHLGSRMLGYLRFRVRVDDGPPRVEILPQL